MSSESVQLSDKFLVGSALMSDDSPKVSQSKRIVQVMDNGNGVNYTSGVITYDATSQLNGTNGFGSLREGVVVIPYVITASTNTNMTAALNRLSLGLKAGVWNVVDQLSLELNGKSIITESDYKLYWNNIRAATEYTQLEMDTHGTDTLMYPDTWETTQYAGLANAPAATAFGDGYYNNITFANSAVGTSGSIGGVAGANTGSLPNAGFQKRLIANPPTVGVNTYGWPSTHLNSTAPMALQKGTGAFIPGVNTAGAVCGTWIYMLKIRLTDLHPIFKELDLCANPQFRLRLKVNTGNCVITATGNATMVLKSSTLLSGNTVPFMIAGVAATQPNNSTFGVATDLTVAFGVASNAYTPSSTTSQYVPFTTSRILIPFYDLIDPRPIISSPVKNIHYLDCYSQIFTGKAGSGVSTSGQQNASFNLQLSASIKNAKYICVLPYADTSASLSHWTTPGLAFPQYQSPFDSAPYTMQPGSYIRNFQVQIGNQNVFSKSQEYDFESFQSEIAKINSLNGDLTTDLANGIMNMNQWSNVQRFMVADVSRLTEKDVPQSIQIAGTNSCSQATTLIVLVIYERSLSLNRLTGEVQRSD